MVELKHWCWSDDGVLQLWMVLTSGYGVFRTAAGQPRDCSKDYSPACFATHTEYRTEYP